MNKPQVAVACLVVSGWITASRALAQDFVGGHDSPAFDFAFLENRITPANWTPAREKAIAALIRDLGHPSFKKREDAADQLTLYMDYAIPQMHRAYHATDDTEVKLRIRKVVLDMYLMENLYLRNGFLGVGIADSLTPEDDPRIPVGGEGIIVGQVVGQDQSGDSGASRAGIQPGDMLISLNGQPLRAAGPPNDKGTFSEMIRLLGAGRRVNIRLIRDNHVMDLPVMLGPRPAEHYNSTPGLIGMEERTYGGFEQWWARKFIPSGGKTPLLRDPALKLWEEEPTPRSGAAPESGAP